MKVKNSRGNGIFIRTEGGLFGPLHRFRLVVTPDRR